MKKLLSVLIALLVTTLTLGVVGCYNIDYSTSDSSSSDSLPDDPVVSLSVELSQSVLTLDRYEEGLLTAIVTDEEGNAIDEEVTWESDNLLVATVENGLVEATGVGSANITVSAGEASATCVVTVEDTGALPVLDVSDESIELVIGSNYSIDANLTYKRNPVEDATISYQMLDTTIATVDEEGNVSALSFGTTTLVIVASWKGIDPAYLTYEMEVSVKEDVVVEIEQTEAVEIYTSNIQLGNVSFVNSATLTSKILVEGSAEGLEESRISWASSNDEVLTVVNGVVTAVGEGTANVTVSYTTDSKTYTSTPLQVKVLFPVVEKEIKVYLDASKATIGEQITANQIFGSEETSIARIYALGESDDLALSTTWLKEHDFGSEAERTYKLVVANAEYGYSVNALVITKLIRTYEELAQLQSYTEVTEGTNAGDATYYSYGGYFMLANNIIATGEEAPFKAPSMGSISSGSHATDLAGFHGTFDGQGYVVKGFKFDIGGIFGDIGDGAVIKNVAFEDCDAAWRNFTANEPARQDGVGVLAANAAGNYLIENVFVESTGTAANAGGLVGRSMKGGTVRNSVIIYNATGGWTMGVLTAWTISAVKLENVYAIMQGKTAQLVGNEQPNIASGSTYTTVAATADATAIEYADLPSDYWFVASGIVPVFNNMVKELVLSQNQVSIDTNGELTLSASLKDITGGVITNNVTWESSNEEVATVENGVLTVLGVGNTVITAKIGGYSATCEVEITEPKLPVEDKTSVTLTLEAKNDKSLAEQLMAEGVEAGLFESFEVASITDATGTELAENYLATADANNAREATLIVYAADKGYKVSALVVTKVITTAEELTKLQDYAGYTTVDASYSETYPATYYNYGGYFVLGNNIIVEDTDSVISARSLEQIASQTQVKEENGFSGVFDGRGYSIVNGRFGAGGLLGDVSKNGVIKNVAFVNATIAEEAKANAGAGVVAYSFCGTAENIFVSYTTLKARNGAFGRGTKGGLIKNVVVHYTKSAGYNGGAIAGTNWTKLTTENVYVIYANGMADADCKLVGETVNHSNTTVEIQEANLASATFTGLNNDLWFVVEGQMPIFNSTVKELVLDQSEVSVDENGEVKLTASLKDIAGGVITNNVTWESSNEEVATVTNGVLTILGVGNTVITAKIGGYSITCEVEITEAEMVVEDLTATTLTLEAKSESSLEEQLMAQGVEAGLFESFEVASITDATGTELAENYLATADANNVREATLIVYAADKGYKVSVLVVTKVITTAQQLVDILDYANNITETVSNNYKTKSYHGYFVLGNNLTQDSANPITFAGPSICNADGTEVPKLDSQWWVIQDGTAGFHGTFDGQGYSIDGFSYGVGGVFGFIGSGAVIKNVAFTNCVTGDSDGATRNESVLAQGAIGGSSNKWLLENVYVQGTMSGHLSGTLFGYYSYDGTISNTVVQVKFTGTCDRVGSIAWQKNNGLVVNNFVGAYEYDAGRYGRDYKPFAYSDNHKESADWAFAEYELRDGATKKITSKTYGSNQISAYTLAESAPTAAEFASFSSTYWTVEEGKTPVFKAKN